MFTLTLPGLGDAVSDEARAELDLDAAAAGHDGRADVTLFEVPRGDGRAALLGLRTVEDVFVEVGRTTRAEGDTAQAIAARLWAAAGVQRALSIWAELVRPLGAAMGFRVIVRVLHERSFLRTDLRRRVSAAIQADRPRWRPADPADLEVWVGEYAPGRFVAGLRVSGSAMRQRDGRASERTGALRPAVAAAMVLRAGEPGGALLDPCCGSGTILREAGHAGWQPRGFDIDPEAVAIATTNAPGVEVEAGDARELPVPDASAGAVVTNLPFGAQYDVPGDPVVWLAAVLGEAARVVRPGGRVVVLHPDIPRAALPTALALDGRTRVSVLGRDATIWTHQRLP